MKKKIVVIEDEPQLRKNLAIILSQENFEPILAEDGASGLDMIRQHNPQMVLCDISLPHLNGIQVLKEIRSTPQMNLTPFIFLTARSEKSDQRMGMALGADDYISKPFTPEDLLRAIHMQMTKQMAWHIDTRNKLSHNTHFVSSVTHDLRSPLSVLLLHLDTLQSEFRSFSEEERKELVSEMRCQITQMNRMIEDILIYGQMETGTLPTQRISTDVVSLAKQIIKDVTLNDGGEHLFELFEGSLSGVVNIDPTLTRQIITNLLANSCRYSAPGTTIKMALQSEGDLLKIEITDYGVGISPREIETLFESFQHITDSGQQHATSYHLFLVKSYVEWLGGTIAVKSVPHQSTTFTIHLPAAEVV